MIELRKELAVGRFIYADSKLVTLFILLLSFNTVKLYGQQSVDQFDILYQEDGITPNYDYYIFGEVHVDNLSNLFKNKSLQNLKKSTEAFYDWLYPYLYDSCDVRNFIFEAPKSYQYFFNKFLVTGDTNWLYIIDGYDFVKLQLKCIGNINRNRDCHVFCIDWETRNDTQTIIDLLFFSLYYEKTFSTEIFNIAGRTEYAFDYFDSIYYAKLKRCELNEIEMQIFDLYSLPTHLSKKILNEVLVNLMIDSSMQSSFKLIFGDQFDYYSNVIKSYLKACGSGKVKMDDRELFMEENIKYILGDKERKGACFSFIGYSHVLLSNEKFRPLINEIVNASNNLSIYSAIVYYPNLRFIYPDWIMKIEVNPLIEVAQQGCNIYKTIGWPEHLIFIKY